MLSMADNGIEFKSTNMVLTGPGLFPTGYGATRRPSMSTRVALGSKPRSETAAAPTAVLEPFSLFETGITLEVTIGRLSRNCSVFCLPDFCMSSWVKVATGFGPTPSAVGMFEPVTMTRSAVAEAAAGAGMIFPCASRAGVVCAGRLQTMAKEIANRTETLRNNPHPRSWIFFIQVRLCREEYEKRPTTFNV